MRRARIRTGAVLLLLVVSASCTDDADSADPTTTATEAPATTTTEAATTTAPPTTPAAAPVEFTACVNPGPSVAEGTEELVEVSLPDGEMTILQSRGFTYRQSLTSVSDPRLEGTLHQAWDKDVYTVPGTEAGPQIVTFTDRIENDEGAWQGSAVLLQFPDDTTYVAPIVMTGEGAYEGMTAIIAFEAFGEDCAVRGYIIDGNVPPPPVLELYG